MRRTLLILPLLSLFVGALFAGAANAATTVRADVNDLTDTSNVILRGEVLSIVSKWTDDGSTIVTLVKLRVDRVFKGKAEKEFTMTCLGGEVGNTRLPISGMPKFSKGEKVVVFLWKNRHGDYIPNGFNLGKFRIEKDPKTGKETAKNSVDGLALRAAPDGKGGYRKLKVKPDVFALPDLEKKITDRMEERRKAELAKQKAAEEKLAAEKKAAGEENKGSEEKKDPVVEEKKTEEPVVDPKPADPKPAKPEQK